MAAGGQINLVPPLNSFQEYAKSSFEASSHAQQVYLPV